MSDINKLSTIEEFTSSMQIPVYDTDNGQPRKGSVLQLQDYLSANPEAPTAPVQLVSYSVAELAAMLPASYTNSVVYCTNGNAGAACLAVSNGSSWLRIAFGAAVSAS